MTRDEFTAKHRPSQGCAPDQWEVEDAREKFGRDLDALLAAARAEALEEADIAVYCRRYLSDWSRDARTSEDARAAIRALVKP